MTLLTCAPSYVRTYMHSLWLAPNECYLHIHIARSVHLEYESIAYFKNVGYIFTAPSEIFWIIAMERREGKN